MWNNIRLLNGINAALVALALLLFAADGLLWVSKRPLFTLRAIRIEGMTDGDVGLRHVNGATVRAAALPRMLNRTRANFFSVNLETVRQAFESVAWVRRAEVRREWPNRLVVRIEEHRALGTWEDGRLVNTFGELFTANLAEAEDDGDLPELSGPAGSERDVATRYRDFSSWFARIGMKPDQVSLSPRYAWSLRLDDGSSAGLQIELGREHDSKTLSDRAERLIVAYPLVTAKWPHLRLADLRYPNGFALRAEGVHVAAENAPPARVVKGAAKSVLKPAAKAGAKAAGKSNPRPAVKVAVNATVKSILGLVRRAGAPSLHNLNAGLAPLRA